MTLSQDLFSNLPSDVTIEIISRLPIPSIISCKCVRKAWLALLQTPEFISSHRSKQAAAALALYNSTAKSYTLFEVADGQLDLEDHEVHCSPVIKFSLPNLKHGTIVASVNGLLLQCYHGKPLTFYLCNPITRDYIELLCPQDLRRARPKVAALGFGACKISGHYKVVTVFKEDELIFEPKWHSYVYTIGGGVWKKIAPPANSVVYVGSGVFLNGNIYWLVTDLMANPSWITCFDLDNEVFSFFSSSPLMAESNALAVVLSAVGDALCLCQNRPEGIDVWFMKGFGAEKCWTKQFVISSGLNFERYSYDVFCPIGVFEDGDVLMTWKLTNFLFCYSKKKNIVRRINNMFESSADTQPFLHTPSFMSLKSFVRENVISF